MTEKTVERLFREGMLAAESYPNPSNNRPYPEGLEDHWWSRGYAYQWRLFRSQDAELKLFALKKKLKKLKRVIDSSNYRDKKLKNPKKKEKKKA